MQLIRRQVVDGQRRFDATLPLDGGGEHVDVAAQYPIAMVEWRDAWFDLDQPDPDDVRSDYLVRTVGFIVGDGPKVLSVAQELLPDGEGFRAVTHIPRAIVERVVRLDAAGY